MEFWRHAALALFGLVGGVGITALGPGGVLPTIGLFTLFDLTPAGVAGTAIVTHIGTGLLGSAAYARSGHLAAPTDRRMAVTLAATALVGTPLGIATNNAVSARAFGFVLAGLAVLVAGAVLLRLSVAATDVHRHGPPTAVVVALGLAVGVVSGIVGIGGPMLTVPLLVAWGTAPLTALAASQVQSVVIAGVGTVGYLVEAHSVDWPLTLVVGIPEIAGVLLGWRIARALPTRTLSYAIVVALLVVAPYLALHG